MNELKTKRLDQIVNTNHRAAAVFEKYRIDFCCQGKRSLEQACEEKQLNLDEVVTDLKKISMTDSCAIPINFDRLTLTQLSDYIVNTHHSYVKKEMPLIAGYLEKVAIKHGDKHPEMLTVKAIFSAIMEEMDLHMNKEEVVLFPRIKATEKLVSEGKEIVITSSHLLSPISMMEQEHEHAGQLLSEINDLTDNYTAPTEACTTFRLSLAALKAFEIDLHQHVHLENNILFPKALKLFDQPGQCNLN